MTINHAEALRKAAAEIRTEGHNGWGNTCEWAAEAIDASQAEIERLTTLEAELWRLSLVIESAVRNADWPNHADVLALIKSIKRPDTALSGSKE